MSRQQSGTTRRTISLCEKVSDAQGKAWQQLTAFEYPILTEALLVIERGKNAHDARLRVHVPDQPHAGLEILTTLAALAVFP
jgi:hypothetical protein